MNKFKHIIRLVQLLFWPLLVVVISAVIWQNNEIQLEAFYLVGKWWQLNDVPLIALLLISLFTGVFLWVSLIMLIKQEGKLRNELVQLRSELKKHKGQTKEVDSTLEAN